MPKKVDPETLCHVSREAESEPVPDFVSNLLLLLFWITLFALTPCYTWTFILIMKWSVLPFMNIYSTLIIQLFSLALGCGFVPCALPFHSYWSKGGSSHGQHFWAKILYIVSLLVSLLLAATALIIIDTYKTPKFVQREYTNYINESLNQNYFPEFATTDIFQNNCCGWDGPTDFGTVFNISRFITEGEISVVKAVSNCYDKTLEIQVVNGVEPENDKNKLLFQSKQSFQLPPGCGSIILQEAQSTCNFIALSSSTTLTLTGLTILILIFTSWRTTTFPYQMKKFFWYRIMMKPNESS